MFFKKIKEVFKDYYWDFQVWSQNIPIDTHIADVKKQIPDYITVDWENPENLGQGLLFRIVKIKGHLKKESVDFLGFVNDLYSGHIFKK